MKKAKSSDADPIDVLYGQTQFLLDCLKSLFNVRLTLPPNLKTNDAGVSWLVEPSEDQCRDALDSILKAYRDIFSIFLRELERLEKLRQISDVQKLIELTFAREKRSRAYIDVALDKCYRGKKLLLYLVEGLSILKDRSIETFKEKIEESKKVWERDGFQLEELQDLKSGIRWELSTIRDMNRDNQKGTQLGKSEPTGSSRNNKDLTKRSNRELLIAILLKHHRFNDPKKNLCTDPISTEEACSLLVKSPGTLSRTWKEIKKGLNYNKYCLICGQYSTLEDFLRMIDSKEGYLERTNKEKAIDYSEE